MATTNPLQFIQQVRTEVAKVVWPTKREVMLTTVMVFILAALTAVFFAIARAPRVVHWLVHRHVRLLALLPLVRLGWSVVTIIAVVSRLGAKVPIRRAPLSGPFRSLATIGPGVSVSDPLRTTAMLMSPAAAK